MDEQVMKEVIRYARERKIKPPEAVRELGERANPYKPFPKKEYLRWVISAMEAEDVLFIEKSRTMMMSWVVSAFCAHWGFTRPATVVIFQSEDEDRAVHDVQYVKTLWEQGPAWLKARWPLSKPLEKQPYNELRLANGSRFKGIPGDPNKIRSEHPTIIVLDEAAHIERGEESYNISMGCSPVKMIPLSSASPGWFQELSEAARPTPWPYAADGMAPDISGFAGPVPGLSLRRTSQGLAVLRVLYSADPDKRAAGWLEAEEKKFTSRALFKQEVLIEYDAREGGLVYPEFDETIHVIPDEQVPKALTRFMSLDPHPRTPHAMLWVGVDEWSDWYVYRELWPSVVYGDSRQLRDNDSENTFTLREYAEAIAALERNEIEWHHAETDQEYGVYRLRHGGERIVYRFMDQAGKAFRASGEGAQIETYARRYDRYGIQCVDPRKSHESGEDAIRQLLKPRYHDARGSWPRLHIAASCRELILEFKKYRYKSIKHWRNQVELYQEGTQYRSHMLDNLRYLATGELAWIRNLKS